MAERTCTQERFPSAGRRGKMCSTFQRGGKVPRNWGGGLSRLRKKGAGALRKGYGSYHLIIGGEPPLPRGGMNFLKSLELSIGRV